MLFGIEISEWVRAAFWVFIIVAMLCIQFWITAQWFAKSPNGALGFAFEVVFVFGVATVIMGLKVALWSVLPLIAGSMLYVAYAIVLQFIRHEVAMGHINDPATASSPFGQDIDPLRPGQFFDQKF